MNRPTGSPPPDPLGDMMRSWAALAGAVVPTPEAAFAGASDDSPGKACSATLAQAQLASAAAAWRVWSRSAQSLLALQQECGAVGSAAPEAQVAHHADAVRAHLRQLGEIALEEARALDAQLQALGEQVRAAVAGPVAEPAPEPRRYARSKP